MSLRKDWGFHLISSTCWNHEILSHLCRYRGCPLSTTYTAYFNFPIVVIAHVIVIGVTVIATFPSPFLFFPATEEACHKLVQLVLNQQYYF